MTDRNDGAELAREKISAFLKAYGKRDIGGLLELVDDDAVLEDVQTVTLQKPVSSIGFSPKARFVIAEDGADFTTYDIELDKITTATLQGDTGASTQLAWLDDYHLWSDRGQTLTMYEFDGANPQQFGTVSEGQAALLSSNKRYLYSFVTSSDGSQQLRVLPLIP